MVILGIIIFFLSFSRKPCRILVILVIVILAENDQKAWLESLFYQDTKDLPGRIGPRDKLQAAKSNPKNTLRVNQDNAGKPEAGRKNSVTYLESVTADKSSSSLF